MDAWPTVVPGAIAGVFALAAAVISYGLSTRAARRDLDGRLEQVTLAGVEARRTAVDQYRLEAEKDFLAGVGPPSGQIIEAIHDLTDRLYSFFGTNATDAPEWLRSDGYYRQTFVWLMVRPFAWLELLRRSHIRLDQTLDTTAVREHRRFQTSCDIFERSFSGLHIFDGIPYDRSSSAAHFFYGTARLAGEAAVTVENSDGICMSYSLFLTRLPEFRSHWLGEYEEFLGGVADDSALGDLRRARLTTIYIAPCLLCNNFPIPFRPQPDPQQAAAQLDLVRDPVLREKVSANVATWLGRCQSRLADSASAAVVELTG